MRVKAMGSRDDDEFEDFVVARTSQLRRVAFLIVRDWQVAEDVVQSAWVKVYVAWPRIRRDSLEAYVRRTVVNVSISVVRRPRRELPTENLPDAAKVDQYWVPDPELVAALGHLSPIQAAVVALRFLEDMAVTDVAATLGISQGTVKSHTSRALNNLRGLMTPSLGSHHGG